METYNNFISQFEIEDNPKKKKGLHRHHIVPECIQKKLYGEVKDLRMVYVTKAQHLWLHILYDRENGTNTARELLCRAKLYGKDFTSYEDCLSFNDIPEPWSGKKNPDQSKRMTGRGNSMYGIRGERNPNYGKTYHKGFHHSEETKKRQSEVMSSLKWFTNGITNVRREEQPEGYWPGYIRRPKVVTN